MNDVQRLKLWMTARGLTNKQMAREMGLSYINLYHNIFVRGEESGAVAGNFIVKFIARYGIDEARKVFAALATPVSA